MLLLYITVNKDGFFLHHRQQRGWLVFKYRYPWKRKLQFGWNKLMNDKYLIAFIYKKNTKKTAQKLSFTITSNCWYFVAIQFILGTYHKIMKVLSWSWSYGNSICNFLCNQFLFINVWRKIVFDICFTGFGTALTTILPILFQYCYKYCYSDNRNFWAVMKSGGLAL